MAAEGTADGACAVGDLAVGDLAGAAVGYAAVAVALAAVGSCGDPWAAAAAGGSAELPSLTQR